MDKPKLTFIKKISAAAGIFILAVVMPFYPVFAQSEIPSITPMTPETPVSTPLPPETPGATPVPEISPDVSPSPIAPSPTTGVTPEPSPTADVTPMPTPFISPTPELIPALTPTLSPPPTSAPSANIKVPSKTRKLAKNVYRGNENIEITVEQGTTTGFNVKLTDDAGNSIDLPMYRKVSDFVTTVVIAPPAEFKPGKYTITVTDSDGTVSVQNFSWGVLAINPNKSVYKPGETAHLAMAVLSPSGRVICDASVRLTVTDPNSGIAMLSTENGLIKVNPDCGNLSADIAPDYEADYTVNSSGLYKMSLEAMTNWGSYSVDDSFEVRDWVPFEIERISATRIYPPNNYSMLLKIKANTDFNGEIAETVPVSFTVASLTGVTDYSRVSVETDRPDIGTDFINLGVPFNGEHPVSLGFGEKVMDKEEKNIYSQFGLSGHDGMDFEMSDGTPVLAADGGTVELAGNGVYGITVVLSHSWGKSYYGHLESTSLVVGSAVKKGDEIGLSGHTGYVTAPHLHFGIKLTINNQDNGYFGKIDPAPFLNSTAQVSASSVKKIYWNVSVRSGETLILGYRFQAPDISPEFYLAGPLRFNLVRQSSPQAGQDLIFEELRSWQIAADATATRTFVFALDAESWAYSDDCAWLSGAFTSGAGYPSGSLMTSGSGSGAATCTAYWEWSGSWENLNVPSGAYVSDVTGSYDYDVSVSTVTSWGTGAFELRDSGSTLRATLVSALTGQTGTVAWTNRAGTAQSFTPEISSTSIILRLNSTMTKTTANKAWTHHNDNIALTITYGPITDIQMRHGNWFAGGAEQGFSF